MARLSIYLLFDRLGEAEVARIREAAPGAEIVTDRDPARQEEHIRRAHVIFGWPRLEWAEAAPGLRWLHLPSAGADRYVTSEALARRGVILTNSSGAFGIPIAEHVLGLMLALARGLHHCVRAQAEGAWRRPPATFELYGKTAGILGLGDIGTEVARRAKAFGMRVLAMKRQPAPPPPFVDALYGPEGLETILRESDFVILCLPATPATERILSAERLRLLKPSAIVINVGRGKLIDEGALVEALQEGRLAGAGLDVFETEPLPPESPLWQMPNVIITPHAAGMTPLHPQRSTDIFVENLRRFLRGEPLINVVDWERGY